MRILVVHNRYQQRGGEDAVFEAEVALLRAHGHEVTTLEFDNATIAAMGPWERARTALGAIYAPSAGRRITAALRASKADVAHFHNTFPLVGTAGYTACQRAGVPVVQTLHNYRMICPNALLLRAGAPCELCVGRHLPWPGVVHACYHESRVESAVVATMLATGRGLGFYDSGVDVYIALTDFARRKFMDGRVPGERIVLKPNFVDPDPGLGSHDGGYALYVGRLSEEKGIRTMLDAWSRLEGRVPLRIVGSGPLLEECRARAIAGVTVLGPLSRGNVFALMGEASVLVFPTLCYEGFPGVIAEAFATGLPVLASALGSSAELIHDGVTGWHVPPGDASALAETVRMIWADPAAMRQRGANARLTYVTQWTADSNYEQLMAIYERALERRLR